LKQRDYDQMIGAWTNLQASVDVANSLARQGAIVIFTTPNTPPVVKIPALDMLPLVLENIEKILKAILDEKGNLKVE